MNQNGAIARLIISSVCCIGVLTYSAYGFIFKNDIKASANFNSGEYYGESNSFKSKESSSSENKTDKSEKDSEKQASSVAAASSDKVKGKIIERFITPYTANTSYNNVYIKNSTNLDIDIKSLLSAKLGFKIKKNDKPQVLIMHTHTTESFMSQNKDYYTEADASRSTNPQKNMIVLGNIVTDNLNKAGIKTLHDKTLHDYPSYNESYSRAANTICSYKEKYPSIKIVIDMHRDAISASDTDKVKVTTTIKGKKAAQIMLVMGSQSGGVTNFPKWKENMKLAVKLQQTLEVMYPTLARSLSLMPRNYNESLTTGSLLIETGTDANTFEEVKYSAQLLADALVSLLNTL